MGMRLSSSALAFGLALLFLAATDRVERKAFVKRGDHFGEGRLEEVGGVRVLHLSGRPFELGFQQGALLKEELAKLSRENWTYARGHAEQFLGWPGWLGRPLLKPILVLRARQLARGMDRDPREELRGLAQGSGLGFSDLLARNFIFGLANLHDGVQFALGPPASQAKELWHGFRGALGEADQSYPADYQAVIFYHPEGKLKFVSVGLIGSSGIITGLNEAGISISRAGDRPEPERSPAAPVAESARQALEQARTLDQAVRMLKGHAPEQSGAVLIGSRAEGKALLLQNSGNESAVREMKDGVVGSGECWPGAWKGQPAGSVKLEDMIALAGTECAAEGHVGRLGVVYEPAGNRVWIALGRSAAGLERWVEVDFASETLREPAAFPGNLNSNQ